MHRLLIAFYLLQTILPVLALPPAVDLYQEASHAQEIQRLHLKIKDLKAKLAQAQEKLTLQQNTKHSCFLSYLSFFKKKHTTQPVDSQEARLHFDKAYEHLVHEDYAQAIEAFRSFVTRYPEHSNIPEVYYFLVQLNLLEGDLDQSLEYAKIFSKKYTRNNRYPEVRLLMGLTYLAQNNDAIATKIFKQLTHHYPNTSVAEKAAVQLKQLEKI